MGALYRWLVRPWLRVQDSERAHRRALLGLRAMGAVVPARWVLRGLYGRKSSASVMFCGTTYNHPFGLAAGMDKNAEALRGWPALGLSFVEIGGVTQHEQQGNPKPRMFRASHAQALVNRMGFNNQGSEKIAARLKLHWDQHGPLPIPLWVNLGKSKITPLGEAEQDYATTMRALWPYATVFVVNVSSPNTPNLRELQNDDGLIRILKACMDVNNTCAKQHGASTKPILVKVAPDLTDEQLIHVVDTARNNGADGMVLANTSLARPLHQHPSDQTAFDEQGGMSGRPVKQRATDMIRLVHRHTEGTWPLVGVGGVSSADDAWEKIRAGASLVQAYSGFVFEGPSLTGNITKGLERHMQQAGFSTLADAVGSEHRNDGVA